MASPNKKRPETWAKRFALNLKTTEDIRQKVEERAQKSGRSITLEVEQQLIKSFEVEEKDALNEEIKAEMRGTIAALEERIAMMQEREDALWPDQAAKALGRTFAMTLAAVQHATGQGWRESPTAPAIVAGVVRRAMEECGRGGSLFADLFNPSRTAAVTDTIARGVVEGLRAKLPPLPEREPEDDPANWTNRAYLAVVFRDKATGDALETVRGEEYDITAPEGRPRLGANYRAALAKFEPVRDAVEVEDFIVYRLRDGAQVWDSLTNPGRRIVMRLTGPEQAARLMVPARGQLPPEIGDRAVFDEAVADLPLVKSERERPHPETPHPETPHPETPQTPVRRRSKAKA